MNKNDIIASIKSVAKAIPFFALIILGLVSAIGAINWAVVSDWNWVFILGAIVGIIETAFASVLYYRKFLKF